MPLKLPFYINALSWFGFWVLVFRGFSVLVFDIFVQSLHFYAILLNDYDVLVLKTVCILLATYRKVLGSGVLQRFLCSGIFVGLVIIFKVYIFTSFWWIMLLVGWIGCYINVEFAERW